MLTHNLGYPRIGSHRELKKACERYWSSQISLAELVEAGRAIRESHWRLQQEAGLDLVPCNDFSFYDHVLDLSLMAGAIPARYRPLLDKPDASGMDLYFAMARGCQKDGLDLIAMEMTKWFDTNYHYLVPEFTKDQTFRLTSRKILDEFQEVQALGINGKPILIGPVSYLLLGKEKEPGFNRLDLLDRLLPVYLQILGELQGLGAEYVQIDEPYLALDLSSESKRAYESAYAAIAQACPGLKIILATYFEGLNGNTRLATSLPVRLLHLDLVRAPAQLDQVLSSMPRQLGLSLGVVDGRNVWKNDFERSLALIGQAVEKLGGDRVALAPSCSLLHAPCDLTFEKDESALPGEVKRWLAFAQQKLHEVATLKRLAQPETHRQYAGRLKENILDMENRRQSVLIHRPKVEQRLAAIRPTDATRQSPFGVRRQKQRATLNLPLFPTTTIGSFPQTDEVRKLRLRLKKGELTGPVTILQWSFVRDDQPRSRTAKQIALAIRDEVHDLEEAGIRIIQIDEPAIREGLPMRRADWKSYLQWAVEAFRLAACGVADETQIHTHMCYSEFNDIIESIAAMDADVITIETSRSQMELLDAFASFRYPNEIGPGVYDIHSPRVPTEQEITALMHKAQAVLPARNLWINPDCGLKTRKWPETRAALVNMVAAAKALRGQGQRELS